MCSLSRYLAVGAIVGLLVATVTASDPLGWLAGLAAVASWYGLERAFPERFGGGTCALPALPPANEDVDGSSPEPAERQPAAR